MSSMRWKLATIALCLALGASSTALAGGGEPAAAVANQVGSFEVAEGDSGTTIRIHGTSVPTFSVFKLSDPPRLFIDISNSELGGDSEMRAVDNGVISQVAMIGVADGGQNVTRVIVGFERAAHYDVRTEGHDVVVFIDGEGRRAPGNDKANTAELEAERARFSAANSELKQTRVKLGQAQKELDRLRGQLTKAQGAKKSEIAARIARKNEELTSLKQERDEQRRNLDALRAERTEALERAERAEALAQKNSAQAKAMRGELDALERQLEKTRADEKGLQGELASQQAQLSTARERARGLEKELQAMRSRASKGDSSAKAAITSLERERDENARQLERAQASINEFHAQVKQADARVQKLEGSIAARDKRIAELEERVRQDGERADLPAGKAVPVDPHAPNIVRDIRLETADGRSRIVVELDRPGRFETLPGRDSRAVMILNNTTLPRDLERTLSAGTRGGAVRFVSSFVDKGQVRMEAEFDGQVAETIRNEGNKLVWEFAPSIARAGEPMQADASPQRTTSGDSLTSAPPRVVTDPTKVNRVPGMSRKRMTIDLRSADIQNVLRLIAKEGGINIIAGDDVGGTITMKLRSVPLEEVFLTILQTQALGFEVRGNVIRVAPQKTLLDEQAARAEVRAKRELNQPLEVFLIPVNYATAGDVLPQVQGLLSQRGSVTVDDRTNTLIVKDIAENLEPIRVLVESLDTQVPQVLIEARIVETNDTFNRQFGIQWGGDFAASQANGNPTGLIFPSVLGLAGAATDGQTPNAGVANATPNYAVNLPAPVGTGSGGGIGLTMGSIGGAVNLSLRLSALEASGSAKIVSSPKILTLDNREATISQGTSIPISVVGAAGVQTVFVQAVLQLTVRPHVTPDGNIQLTINASKNEPDFQNTGARGDPTIIRRDATTELLIKDGDTTVIGGIYTRNAGSSVSMVPFFHKIPILGVFFRTTSQSERRNELLIFITPRIVNRAQSLGSVSAGAVSPGAANSAGK